MTSLFARVALGGVLLAPTLVSAQAAPRRVAAPDPWAVLTRPRARPAAPTTGAITVADLMTRLYLFADDSMEGRRVGTKGNAVGAEYIAAELQKLGVEPAGENGTFFQSVPVGTRTLDVSTPLAINGTRLAPWTDYLPRDQGDGARMVDGAQAIFGGTWGEPSSLIGPSAAAGKLVVLAVSPAGYSGRIPGAVARDSVSDRFPGAAGIAIVGLDVMPPALTELLRASEPGVKVLEAPVKPAFLYITKRTADAMLGAAMEAIRPGVAGRTVTGTVRFRDTPLEYPTRNVVGLIRGSDPTLRGQYVVIGAHNDHVGVDAQAVAHDSIYVVNHLYRKSGADDPDPTLGRLDYAKVNGILAAVRKKTGGASSRPDSINNGADDDGSGSMGILEIAQYFASQAVKPKRSLLFVWHVGEEEGLWGSAYFTDHPTVPRDSMVAELNVDMIGRGDATDVTGQTKAGGQIHGAPNYVQVIGSRRLSTELGALAERVNIAGKHNLKFDYALDANNHPQQIYCRSDHYEYARYGIPIAFFTTGGHADYHQVTDEPQYINYPHMLRVATFIADLAKGIANLDHRLVVDKPKPDPQGQCLQ